MPTLALIHTTAVTVPTFKDLAATHLPGVRVINLLDDSLLSDVMAAGHVTDAVRQRLEAYVGQARRAGADAVMSCCSTIGAVMENLGCWRVDEAMAAEAVARGPRVGVIATVPTTLGPTADLIRRQAMERQAEVQVETVVVDGAFAALQAGRAAEHDEKVLAALEALLSRSDVVVLAQASMARLVQTLKTPPRIPILTSPVSGLQLAATRLEKQTVTP